VGQTSTYPNQAGERLTERYGRTSDGRLVQTRVDDLAVCLRSAGAVTWSADGARIEGVAEGGWVLLATRSGEREMALAVTSGGSEPAFRWTVDGQLRPFGPDAAAWRDALLPVLASFWEASQASVRAISLARELSAEGTRLFNVGGGLAMVEAAEARRRERETRAAVADTARDPAAVDSIRGDMEARFRAEVEALRRSLELRDAGSDPDTALINEREERVRLLGRLNDQGVYQRRLLGAMILPDRPVRASEALPVLRAWELEMAAVERAMAQLQEAAGSQLARLREAIANIP
jgi:hypothetical protein